VDPAHLAAVQGDTTPWFMRYGMSQPVRQSLGRFFRDTEGLQAHFIAALSRVARRLRHQPEIIGCELWNEPFPGDLPFERFEKDHLQPFYERAIAAVHHAAPFWLIFFEGVLLRSEQGTELTLSGPGLVYAPHFYDKMVFMTRRYDGDRSEMHHVLLTYERDAERMGVPWILSEYGVAQAADGGCAYLQDQELALSRHMAGGTAWHYNPTEEDWNDEGMSLVGPGGAETPLCGALCRPYPITVAGTPLVYGFDDERRTFFLRYQPDPVAAGAETVVFLPRRHFGEEAARIPVRLSSGEYTIDLERQLLFISGTDNDGEVVLEIG
jgi:endoglycosylceramidase